MQRYVLIIGGDANLEQALRAITAEYCIQISSVSLVAEAKRLLLKQIPELIMCALEIDQESNTGINFCKQLKDHPQLGSVPVILFSAIVDQATIRNAAISGARGFITIPTSTEMLRHRVDAFLSKPSIDKITEVTKETVVDTTPSKTVQNVTPIVNKTSNIDIQENMQGSSAIGLSIADGTDEDLQKKLEIARGIVNKVLHNLQTSQLLQVVDIDDIPKVVAEITRSVCGINSDAVKGKDKGR